MQITNYSKKTAVTIFASLFAWIIIFTHCTSVTANKDNFIKEDDKTCKLIKASEINAALAKSKSKKIILNIYPVKLSNNLQKRDFDLKISFHDAAEPTKSINEKSNEKLFKTQSDWYVGYLKNRNVPKNKVPVGYFMQIDSSFLKTSVGLSFCHTAGQDNVNYFLLTDKPDKDDASAKKDSTCKCPPDCCKYYVLATDSTGKCPPECGEYLLYRPFIESIIQKKYGNK